jgi:hypothetical protein
MRPLPPGPPHTRQWSVAKTDIAGGAPLRCYSASDDRAPFPPCILAPEDSARPHSRRAFLRPAL